MSLIKKRRMPVVLFLGALAATCFTVPMAVSNSRLLVDFEETVEYEVDVSKMEVFEPVKKVVDPSLVPKAMKDVEKLVDLIAQENSLVLMRRAPSTEKQERQAPAPDPFGLSAKPPTSEKARVYRPSSGDWLSGNVLLRDSGLILIDSSRALFRKGDEIADFRVGMVLPNGEVVVSVNPVELFVLTDRRLIQIMDDGS